MQFLIITVLFLAHLGEQVDVELSDGIHELLRNVDAKVINEG
jgi:hypothetical protein